MTTGGFMKVETSPRGVLYKHEVITYLGGNEELFKSLCEDYGLRPVYKRATRIMYRVTALEDCLREKELAEGNEN